MKKETKLATATEIVRNQTDKKGAIAEIQNVLGVTKSNAFVYYTKATKILGGDTVTVKKEPTNKVTQTTDKKKAVKLAEIDQVIADLKRTGATVASPFAGVGA